MADKGFGLNQLNFTGIAGTSLIESGDTLQVNAPLFSVSTDFSVGGKVNSNIILSSSYSIGIGSTQPKEKLDVLGNINVSGSVTATSFVGSGTDLIGVAKNTISAIDENNYYYPILTPSSANAGTYSTVVVPSSKLVFNPSGLLGIGSTTPNYNLDVVGTGRFTGNLIASSFVGNLTGTATTASGLTATSSQLFVSSAIINSIDFFPAGSSSI